MMWPNIINKNKLPSAVPSSQRVITADSSTYFIYFYNTRSSWHEPQGICVSSHDQNGELSLVSEKCKPPHCGAT